MNFRSEKRLAILPKTVEYRDDKNDYTAAGHIEKLGQP